MLPWVLQINHNPTKERSVMTRHRKLSTFLRRTPRGAVMSAICATLIVLLAACGGGTPNPNPGSGNTGSSNAGGGGLPGGTDISGHTILFQIQSSPSDSFFVPVVNGANASAHIACLK